MHVTLGAGARSIAIDKRSPHFGTVVDAAINWADAVVVGARPIDAARMGLDFACVAKVNPDVVYCLISGYGENGPWQDFTAHGQTMDAMAGLVPIEWVDGTPRTPAGWRSSGTTLAGIYAALGIMYALYRKARGTPGPSTSVCRCGRPPWPGAGVTWPAWPIWTSLGTSTWTWAPATRCTAPPTTGW